MPLSIKKYKQLFFSQYHVVGVTLTILLVCVLQFKGSAPERAFARGYLPSDFFQQQRFNGDFFMTLPLSDIEATMKRIKADVPPPLQYICYANTYYHIQGKFGLPFEFQYLDACDRFLPADSMRVFTQTTRARLLITEQKNDKARECLMEAIDLNMKAGKMTQRADVLWQLGICEARDGYYDRALKHLFAADEHYETLLNKSVLVSYYEIKVAIASVFSLKKDYENAFKWLEKAYNYTINFREHESDLFVIADLIGSTFIERGRLPEAEYWYKVAQDHINHLNARLKTNYTYDIAVHWSLTGRLAFAKKQYDVAEYAFKKAISVPDGGRRLTSLYQYYAYLANTYTALNQYDSALIYYHKALANKDLPHKMDVFKGLDTLYQLQKRFDQSVAVKDSIYALEQQIFTVEKDRQVAEIQALRTLSEKEKALLEAEEDQNLLTISLVFCVLLGFWAFSLNGVKVREHAYRERMREVEIELAAAEVDRQKLVLNSLSVDLATKNDEIEEKDKILALKNSLISDLETRLYTIDGGSDASAVRRLSASALQFLTKDDWQRFLNNFEQSFPGFINALKGRFPQLTPSEIRLFLLIKIGLDSAELAATLGISAESTYKSRYRLRQKLALTEGAVLEAFVKNFEPHE